MEAEHIVAEQQPVSSPTLAERVRRVWALRQALERANRIASAAEKRVRVRQDALGAERSRIHSKFDRLGAMVHLVMYHPFHSLTDADLAEAIRVAEERDAADSR